MSQVVVTTEQAVVASLSIELDGELLHAVRTPRIMNSVNPLKSHIASPFLA